VPGESPGRDADGVGTVLAEHFFVDITSLADRHLVQLEGAVDLGTADELAERLAGCDDKDTVIDLAGVTFIDGQGMRVLAARAAQLEEPAFS
jgi:anti-anti-sigma regulatory factor